MSASAQGQRSRNEEEGWVRGESVGWHGCSGAEASVSAGEKHCAGSQGSVSDSELKSMKTECSRMAGLATVLLDGRGGRL